MNEHKNIESEELYRKEIMSNHEAQILVVCMHGRSRSKAIAKLLREEFGYLNAMALGIKDLGITSEEKINQIEHSQLLMYVESDVWGEIRHLLNEAKAVWAVDDKAISFFLTQLEHQALSSDPGMRFKKDEALTAIKRRLFETGFKYKSK